MKIKRKNAKLLATALEKLCIQKDAVYTWHEDNGYVVIVTLDGRRCLYQAEGSVAPQKEFAEVYLEKGQFTSTVKNTQIRTKSGDLINWPYEDLPDMDVSNVDKKENSRFCT